MEECENRLSPQSNRRLLLEQWKMQKKAQTPKPTHAPPQRVAVHSEKKHVLASGAARVAVWSRTHHVLESPALRVKAAEENKELTTPTMGRPKTVPKTEVAKTAKTEKKTVSVQAERITVHMPEKKTLHFESEVQPRKPPAPLATPVVSVTAAAAATPRPVLQRSDSVSMRLTSALAAAYRATMGGNLAFARRIYTGILNDAERFENVESSSAFWMSYAMYEEHCGNYKAALQLYERGLEMVADRSDLSANLYLFILRMDERIAVATAPGAEGDESHVVALQEFAVYVKSNQPAVLEKMEEDKKINGATPVKHKEQLDSLMKDVAVPDAVKVKEADRAATVMEATTPRRSARLADKERKNYSNLLPWWLQDEDWQVK